MEEIPKNYSSLTYDQVISKAQAIQPYFAEDFPQFSAYDPWFTSAANTDLLSSIYLGMKDFSESRLIDEIKRINGLLDTTLTDAIRYYQELNHYVDLGFKDTTIGNEAFGYSSLEKARHSVKKMIALLNRTHAAISNQGYETSLLEVGMPDGLAHDMANIATELASLYGELKILKRQHLLLTQERIKLFNSIWEILSKIGEDAKIIFANDPGRLAIYDLYDTGAWNVDIMEFMHLN